MRRAEKDQEPWEKAETVFSNDFFTITDERLIGSIGVASRTGGFTFTLPYEEWSQFVEVVRLLETQNDVETDVCSASQVSADGETEWDFAIHFPEHELAFYLGQDEWQGLEEAVEVAADYPWSPVLYRVDVARMRDKVAEQHRWLNKRQRKGGA